MRAFATVAEELPRPSYIYHSPGGSHRLLHAHLAASLVVLSSMVQCPKRARCIGRQMCSGMTVQCALLVPAGSSMSEPRLGTGHSLGSPVYEIDRKPERSAGRKSEPTAEEEAGYLVSTMFACHRVLARVLSLSLCPACCVSGQLYIV